MGTHLVAVVQGRDNLSEEMPGVSLAQPWPLADVIIQITPAGILHDNHDLAAILKHWRGEVRLSGLPESTDPLWVTVSSTASNQIGPPSGLPATGASGQRIRAGEEPLKAQHLLGRASEVSG